MPDHPLDRVFVTAFTPLSLKYFGFGGRWNIKEAIPFIQVHFK